VDPATLARLLLHRTDPFLGEYKLRETNISVCFKKSDYSVYSTRPNPASALTISPLLVALPMVVAFNANLQSELLILGDGHPFDH
jgi:hypothetical protein